MTDSVAINSFNAEDNKNQLVEAPVEISKLLVPTKAAKSTRYVIRLFALRIAHPDENWKIQAIFDEKMKHDFEKIANLAPTQVSRYI